MSDVVLLLGPVAFQDFEIPSKIQFGGEQRLAIHRLAGGERIIDSIGRDDAEITFCGIISGSDATLRARALDTLRAEGLPLPLTWDVFFYSVLIRSFEADYQSNWWIPYRIACTVVRDEAGALVTRALSLATAAISDVGSAIVQAIPAGYDLSGTQTALEAPNATTRGTAAFSFAQTSLATASSSISTGIVSAESGMNSVSGALASATSAQDGIGALNAATANAQQLSLLSSAKSYVGRAAANMANAST